MTAERPVPAPAVRRPWVVLRNREVRALLAAQVLSELGDALARVALAVLVLERSGSAFLAAAVFAVAFFPAVFGSALLGALGDWFPRKGVLVVCDAARAVVIAVLALVAVDGTPTAVLLLLLFAAEVFTSPFAAARGALLPEVAPDPRDYTAAYAASRVLYQVDQVLGLLLAGLAVALLGVRTALLLDALTFLVSLLLLATMLRSRAAATQRGGTRRLLADTREGARLVFSDPVLRTLVLTGWGAALVIIAPEAVAIAYARFDGAPTEAGAVLMASLPLGAAIGAALVSRLPQQRQLGLVVPLFTCACVALLGTSVAPPWPVTAVLWFVSGLCQGFMVPLITTVNLLTPSTHRARVNGLAGAGFYVSTSLSFLLTGALADATSPAVAVTAAGCVGVLLVGVARQEWPRGAIRRAAAEAYGPVPPGNDG